MGLDELRLRDGCGQGGIFGGGDGVVEELEDVEVGFGDEVKGLVREEGVENLVGIDEMV